MLLNFDKVNSRSSSISTHRREANNLRAKYFEVRTSLFAILEDLFTSKEMYNNLFVVLDIYYLMYLKNYSCVPFEI